MRGGRAFRQEVRRSSPSLLATRHEQIGQGPHQGVERGRVNGRPNNLRSRNSASSNECRSFHATQSVNSLIRQDHRPVDGGVQQFSHEGASASQPSAVDQRWLKLAPGNQARFQVPTLRNVDKRPEKGRAPRSSLTPT